MCKLVITLILLSLFTNYAYSLTFLNRCYHLDNNSMYHDNTSRVIYLYRFKYIMYHIDSIGSNITINMDIYNNTYTHILPTCSDSSDTVYNGYYTFRYKDNPYNIYPICDNNILRYGTYISNITLDNIINNYFTIHSIDDKLYIDNKEFSITVYPENGIRVLLCGIWHNKTYTY